MDNKVANLYLKIGERKRTSKKYREMISIATIYELTDEYKQLLEMLSDPNYLEFEEAVRETLNLKGDELETKADAYMYVCKQLEADAKALKEEEDRLAARRKAAENNAKRIKKTIEAVMIETNKRKFKTLKFSYWIQNNAPSLDVWDEKLVPKGYFTPQPDKLDTEQLKRDILGGITVSGACLMQSESIRVR